MSDGQSKNSKRARNAERILYFVHQYIEREGYAPAIRDICDGLGFKSTSTVHAYLKLLQERGYIQYAAGKRRAISVAGSETDGGGSADPNRGVESSDALPEGGWQLIRRRGKQQAGVSTEDDTVIGYPIIGTVTAGRPVLAEEQIERTLKLSDDLFRARGDVFMLHVKGDSMVDAAILDGDLVVVEQAETAPLYSIVVGMIDGEATVKRLIQLDGRPYLQPENEAYDLIPFDREDCRILGRVIGVIRRSV